MGDRKGATLKIHSTGPNPTRIAFSFHFSASEMTFIVSGGALNSTHLLTYFSFHRHHPIIHLNSALKILVANFRQG